MTKIKSKSSHASLFSFWGGRKPEAALDLFLNNRARRKDAPKFMSFGAVWQKAFWVGLPPGWRIKKRIWNLKKEGSSTSSCSLSLSAWLNHRNKICRDKSLFKCANSKREPFQNTEKDSERIIFLMPVSVSFLPLLPMLGTEKYSLCLFYNILYSATHRPPCISGKSSINVATSVGLRAVM